MSQIIQVRDVPDDVHRTLVDQAGRAGLSLNKYLLAELERIAARSRNEAIFERAQNEAAKARDPITSDEIVAIIRDLRGD